MIRKTGSAFLATLALWISGAGAATVTTSLTSSGTWTAPAGVTSVTVEAWGGGGAGGGATANPGKGGGGAGGQYARKVVTVVPGNNYAIVVGTGGSGSTGAGGAGGDSTFAATAVVAKGGAGGSAATNGVGGAGSTTGGVGSVVYAGGSGSSATAATGVGGAGGGGAGSGGAGGSASGNTAGTGTATSGGNGAAGRTSGGSGAAGSNYGGGGAGGYATTNTNRSGGDGGDGLVVLSYVQPPSVVSIARASSNPTMGAASVSWTVTFSAAVTGVDAGDFLLVPGGGVSGAAITPPVTGSGTTWTVTAGTGSGTGSLGLNLVDDDSIVDAADALPLGGTGSGNGNFTGEVYNVTATFCSPPANTPAGLSLTCVCDTFGRAALNPSTIFGGNWSLSNSEGAGGTNPYINATTGLLRLTENTANNAKSATVPSIFPAAGNYISVEFNHYAYNGTNPGADGVAITLSDSSIPAVPGGFGGSLGYAQRNDGVQPPGFAGGWVGIALDEWGNYQNPTEGRVLGSGFIAQAIGVRGPGSGANGYRFMGGTGSNPGGLAIDNRASTSPAPGYMYQVIVDARNYATGTVNVSVNRDATTKNGTTYGASSLFGPFNAYTEANYALGQGWITKLVPDYWKISFTGSTGGANNIHEIGSLRVCAQTVLPPTGGTASGFAAIDEAYPGAPTVPAYPNFQTGNIYMKLTGVPFKLWLAALTGTGISTGYSATSNKYVQVKLVSNSDNACGPDSARTCNASCTNKTAVESGAGATQIATFVSGGTTGVASPSPSFTLNSAWNNLVAVMKECTTSACTAFTATAPACSADSFSVRPTSVSALTSTNATNSTTGGVPVFKAGTDNFTLVATTAGIAGNANGYTGTLKINNSALVPVSPATVAGIVTPTTFPSAVSATPSATSTGSTFIYSEVGAFTLPGYNPATNATAARGVYEGVDSASECPSPMTQAQCDVIRAATWTGVDSVSTKGDCIADSYSNTKVNGKYGCNFGIVSDTAVIGRFVPNEFRVSGVTLTNRQALACAPASTFSYLDEPMGLSFTLEARGGSGNITRNYAGALAKLVLTPSATSIASLAFGAAALTPPFSALSTRVSASGYVPQPPGPPSATCYSEPTNGWPAIPDATATCPSGVVTLSGTVAVSSLTNPANNRVSPDGPFQGVQVGIAPIDSDGVRVLAYDLDVDNSGGVSGPDHKSLNPVPTFPATAPAPTTLYFGQMRFWPAHGSERQPLAVNAEVLRWNGAAFVPNGDDNCTAVPAARLGLRDYARNLNAGETAITSGALTFAGGKGRIVLSAPGAGNSGSVNVWGDLGTAGLNYLYGRWPALPGVVDATPTKYDNPPWATLTFGVYKGQWIDMRENYFY